MGYLGKFVGKWNLGLRKYQVVPSDISALAFSELENSSYEVYAETDESGNENGAYWLSVNGLERPSEIGSMKDLEEWLTDGISERLIEDMENLSVECELNAEALTAEQLKEVLVFGENQGTTDRHSVGKYEIDGDFGYIEVEVLNEDGDFKVL